MIGRDVIGVATQDGTLLFFPCDNYGFSALMVSRHPGQGMALACEALLSLRASLAVNIDKLTESEKITWIGR